MSHIVEKSSLIVSTDSDIDSNIFFDPTRLLPVHNSFREKKNVKHKCKAKEAKTAAVTVKDTGIKVIRTTFIAVKKQYRLFLLWHLPD